MDKVLTTKILEVKKGIIASLKNSTRLLVYVCLFVVLLSCTDREIYYEFKELQDAEWNIDKVLHFEIDTLEVDPNEKFDISIEITNNVNYPYQNLWLFSEYNKNDSTIIKNEEEFVLSDEFGKWQGAGFSSLYQSSHIVLRSISFDERKKYNIYIRHGMQDKLLHGIEKVGIKIQKSKE